MTSAAKIPLFKVNMAPGVSDAIAKTIASGTITEGPRVLEFEKWLTWYLGAPVLTMNSATSALQLATELLELRPGDEVISTPITCVATNLALMHAGATIVWADVSRTTGLIDPIDIARKVTKRTRAVMAVDWGGALCEFDVLAVAANGRPVIEDAAHAFGAVRGDANTGAFATCWSFQAIKHLTTGDGGGLFIRDEQARERARLLRWFGIDRQAPGPNIDKPITYAGHKWHMNDLVATIGLANSEHAVAALRRHRENAAWYRDQLWDVPGFILPPPDHGSAWWFYSVILVDGKQREFTEFMASRGIECSRVHARNDTHQVFDGARGGAHTGELPGVDYFDSHQIAIPVGWFVGDDDRARIAEAMRDWSKRR